MGQYYNCVILKKDWKKITNPIRAALYPLDFNTGLKLMEHSYVRNDYVSAFMQLVHELDHDRSGVPAVWCGDYADTISTAGMPLFEVLNTATRRRDTVGGLQVHKEAYNWMKTDNGNTVDYIAALALIYDHNMHNYRYIINHTKKQYVEVPAHKKDKWIIHPLPILLSDGSGRGDGDYHDVICTNPEEKDWYKRKYVKKHNAQFVGLWAYDDISVTNRKTDTEGYERIDWEVEEKI